MPGFWSPQTFRSRLNEVIRLPNGEHPSNEHIKCGAYELAVGPEAYVTSDKDAKTRLEGNLIIPPGQFALLLTEETVMIPRNMIGFISIKFGKKWSGLVNVSGFHVDPGFHGRLKFSVYNAGGRPIILQKSERLFLLWLASLDAEADPPYSTKHEHQGQNSITPEDVMRIYGDIPSPAALSERINDLERKYRNLAWIAGVLIGAGLAAIVRYVLQGQ